MKLGHKFTVSVYALMLTFISRYTCFIIIAFFEYAYKPFHLEDLKANSPY